MLSYDPMNSLTVCPMASIIAASSVASCFMRECASSNRSYANAWGVCAAQRYSLGGVSLTLKSDLATFMVSLTGTAAVAAPNSEAASTARSMISLADERTRPVVYQRDLGPLQIQKRVQNRILPARAALHDASNLCEP